jgi:hypothetical protein
MAGVRRLIEASKRGVDTVTHLKHCAWLPTFYDGPHDVHTIGRNARSTQPAKFLVLLVKNTGVEPVLPAPVWPTE